MAVNSIIEAMNAGGIPATLELGNGKWCHSPEYTKRRYGGPLRKKAVEVIEVKASKTFNELMRRLEEDKLTPSERIHLIAMLRDK